MAEQRLSEPVDLEPLRERQRLQEGDVLAAEGACHPCVQAVAVGVTGDEPVRVPPDPHRPFAQPTETLQRLHGLWPVDAVAPEHDDVHVLALYLGQHRLERRQVSVDVVERGDLHRPRSVNSVTASSRVASSSAPSYGVRRWSRSSSQ